MTVSTRAIGWYGKVPSLGDFVRRGLDAQFIAAWDAWLQRSISHARTQRGRPFDDTVRAFPTWRFFIPPGVIGPGAWCGVLQASSDRVGRSFPFTFAQPLLLADDAVVDSERLEVYVDGFARAAVAALDPRSLAAFEQQAAVLAAGDQAIGAARPDGLSALPSVTTLQGQPLQGGLAQALGGDHWLISQLRGRTLWWLPAGADDHGAVLLSEFPYGDDLLLTLLDVA